MSPHLLLSNQQSLSKVFLPQSPQFFNARQSLNSNTNISTHVHQNYQIQKIHHQRKSQIINYQQPFVNQNLTQTVYVDPRRNSIISPQNIRD
jgi:hypothetical protein